MVSINYDYYNNFITDYLFTLLLLYYTIDILISYTIHMFLLFNPEVYSIESKN